MKLFESQSENPDILKSSRDLTMFLGRLFFSEENSLSESLEITLGKTNLSLWKMYEVNLAIYCFSSLWTKNFKLKSYLRLIKKTDS